MTWRLLHKVSPILTGASVLEPSCGTGVFFETAPVGPAPKGPAPGGPVPWELSLHGVELDPRASAIARLLFPRAAVTQSSFEHFVISNGQAQFSHVIGNVPFGDRSVNTSYADLPEETSMDRYFLTRSLDMLDGEGTLALIIHPGILKNKTNAPFRVEISKKAQFLGAVKLNDGSFRHARTSIQPDILFFKKYPLDIVQRLAPLPPETITDDSFPLPPDTRWINGDYFNHTPRHIMGILREGSGPWGSDTVQGAITLTALKNMIETFTPASPRGPALFDAVRSRYEIPREKTAGNILYINDSERDAIQQKALLPGTIKLVSDHHAVYVLSDSYQWTLAQSKNPALYAKISKIVPLSQHIKSIHLQMNQNASPRSLQETARTLLTDYKNTYGEYPLYDTDIKKFLRSHPAVRDIYESFVQPSNDILTRANIYTHEGPAIDGHTHAVSVLRDLRERQIEATEENLSRYHPREYTALIPQFLTNPDIFLSPSHVWELREDFISGNAYDKIDSLMSARAKETGDRSIAKFNYGIEQLRQAVGYKTIEESDLSPHSSWIPESIVNDWIKDKDGLDRPGLLRNGYISKNEEGKWGIRFTGKPRYDEENHALINTCEGQWSELYDTVIYYLNMQKQRSQYKDTALVNQEYTDSFLAYIATHAHYRDIIEKKYNTLFNAEIKAPVKTYPVFLDGWNTASKTLKPHQWQSVHHLYRQQRGICALGTGFGKTLAATGLHALLSQENKIRRAWFQVPNNKVKDWVEEIKSVLPGYKIGFVDPEMPGYSSREKRYAHYQTIINTTCDIIILPESSASEIQLSPVTDKEIVDTVAAQHLAGKKLSTRKFQLEKDSEERKLSSGKTNKTVFFEDFGCDAIFVDEAHNYKNLFCSTLSRDTGMNDGRQSAKAMALFKKTEYVRRKNDGKNIFLFTATPLTNSPLEYYNMLLYVAPEELERFSINTIDSFIKNFADIIEGETYDWKTGQITTGKILTGFKNIKTLQDIFFKYTDYQNDPAAINIEKPSSFNKPNVIPKDTTQSAILKEISDELEAYKACPKEKRNEKFPNQNFLTFYSRLRTASLDIELYAPHAHRQWQNPKLKTLAHNVKTIYEKTAAGQVVFCDRVFSSDLSFNMHDKIKSFLVAEGFKEPDIIVINGFTKSGGFKSDSQVEKEVSQAVDAFNKGKYKVLIGSTACIGEGLNLQKNSAAIHHFDIPFRPSDFIQRNGRIDRQGNTQKEVELHSYLSAGTIDNYSVSLIQRKANWIDQLLKTKSNVFLNPNDQNFIDADELLMALTKEWADPALIESRRKELERIKQEKILAAKDSERRSLLAALSLLRAATFRYSGDTTAPPYKKRLEKIKDIQNILTHNPTFKNTELLKTNAPFLYHKQKDLAICRGDFLVYNQLFSEIIALNVKKKEFIYTQINEKGAPSSLSEHMTDTIDYFVDSYRYAQKTIIPHHLIKNKTALFSINTEQFYHLNDPPLQEALYPYHVKICYDGSSSFVPPVFFLIENKCSVVFNKTNYSNNNDSTLLNPFTGNNYARIKECLSHASFDEEKMSLLRLCFPQRPAAPSPSPAVSRKSPRYGTDDPVILTFKSRLLMLGKTDQFNQNILAAAAFIIKNMDEHNKNRLNIILKQSGCDSPEHTAAILSRWVSESQKRDTVPPPPAPALSLPPGRKKNPAPSESPVPFGEAS
jgi:hypothetical protein